MKKLNTSDTLLKLHLDFFSQSHWKAYINLSINGLGIKFSIKLGTTIRLSFVATKTEIRSLEVKRTSILFIPVFLRSKFNAHQLE